MMKKIFITLAFSICFYANANANANSNTNSDGMISLKNMRGIHFELKVPLKLICNSKNTIGFQKGQNGLAWQPAFSEDTSSSFILIFNKLNNLDAKDKDECLSEIMETTRDSQEFREYQIEKGEYICGIKQFHTKKNEKLYKSCRPSFSKDYKGIRCNDFIYDLSNKNYLEPMEAEWMLILGAASISQGLCTEIP